MLLLLDLRVYQERGRQKACRVLLKQRRIQHGCNSLYLVTSEALVPDANTTSTIPFPLTHVVSRKYGTAQNAKKALSIHASSRQQPNDLLDGPGDQLRVLGLQGGEVDAPTIVVLLLGPVLAV